MPVGLLLLRTIGKIFLSQVFLLQVAGIPAFGNIHYSVDYDSVFSGKKNKYNSSGIEERLEVFYPVDSADYSLTICADLPDNNNTKRVYKKGEPGHVFLILSKKSIVTGETINRSFGFYPRLAVTCFFKQSRSRILDNHDREYNASIGKKLSKIEFEGILEKCRELAKKKYNLKKYNCYDYVIEVFNSLPGIEKLPVTKVKFPFIFGRGGSPCGLYSDLEKLASNGSAWASAIRFGVFRSPDRHTSQTLAASD
jgi:hypothetical protein